MKISQKDPGSNCNHKEPQVNKERIIQTLVQNHRRDTQDQVFKEIIISLGFYTQKDQNKQLVG